MIISRPCSDVKQEKESEEEGEGYHGGLRRRI